MAARGACAQQAGNKLARLLVFWAPLLPWLGAPQSVRAFAGRLNDLGWVEGQTRSIIDFRWAEGKYEPC